MDVGWLNLIYFDTCGSLLNIPVMYWYINVVSSSYFLCTMMTPSTRQSDECYPESHSIGSLIYYSCNVLLFCMCLIYNVHPLLIHVCQDSSTHRYIDLFSPHLTMTSIIVVHTPIEDSERVRKYLHLYIFTLRYNTLENSATKLKCKSTYHFLSSL